MKLDAMLVGKITSRPTGMTISAELVDGHGFMLWGDSFDCELKDILEIQDEIARQISAALRLKLTGEEEKRMTTRYTENSEAYQAYMEGRFHWSRYTRTEIEKAIEHFRAAIKLDPNYALAYSGIVDCYLRLATNYLPPENYLSACDQLSAEEEEWKVCEQGSAEATTSADGKPGSKVDLRHEWDWKGAERELRRANELKKDYPAAHQWHAAYLLSRRLCQAASPKAVTTLLNSSRKDLTARIPSINLTAAEDVQVVCTIAREQIDSGNYDAAALVLSKWWSFGDVPKLGGLPSESCADLLFTAGELAGFVASAKQIPTGQKSGEMLLSGAIAFFEQLGSVARSAEARIELAMCYYRQGNFDLARSLLLRVLEDLTTDENELRSLVLIRLACLERHSGRSFEALRRLEEAQCFVEASGPWATGRHHLELGSTYKDLAIAEGDDSLFDRSLTQHRLALYEFEAIGNLRLMAIAENNLGFLKVCADQLKDAVSHLDNAWSLFDQLGDQVRRAQVDDTIARLHLAEGKIKLADDAACRAVAMLESGDEDALLAEALTTKALVHVKLERYGEAKRLFEMAHGVALRCGDREGSGRALLIMLEEMVCYLTSEERNDIAERLSQLLNYSQQPSIKRRLAAAVKSIGGLA
jgi:tetratricopeptide (TPR) repeat protein